MHHIDWIYIDIYIYSHCIEWIRNVWHSCVGENVFDASFFLSDLLVVIGVFIFILKKLNVAHTRCFSSTQHKYFVNWFYSHISFKVNFVFLCVFIYKNKNKKTKKNVRSFQWHIRRLKSWCSFNRFHFERIHFNCFSNFDMAQITNKSINAFDNCNRTVRIWIYRYR